jgi:hypothetical protein
MEKDNKGVTGCFGCGTMRRSSIRKGAGDTSARKNGTTHSRTKDGDDGVAVLFSAVYAVYDEGFEKDGAVL